jgi:hypothetical protein
MAMGIPVIVCRHKSGPRFSFLERLIPIYLPDDFERIDWSPTPVDLGSGQPNWLDKRQDSGCDRFSMRRRFAAAS